MIYCVCSIDVKIRNQYRTRNLLMLIAYGLTSKINVTEVISLHPEEERFQCIDETLAVLRRCRQERIMLARPSMSTDTLQCYRGGIAH